MRSAFTQKRPKKVSQVPPTAWLEPVVCFAGIIYILFHMVGQ